MGDADDRKGRPYGVVGATLAVARCTLVVLVERPDEVAELLHALGGHGVVDRGPHAARPTKGFAFRGDPDDLTSSAEMNSACGKILAFGQNAWTRLSAAPRVAGTWAARGPQFARSKALMKSQSFSTPSTGMAL